MSGSSSHRSRFHPGHATSSGSAALHAERLYGLLGKERPCDEVARVLRTFVQSLRAPVVGAMRVSCSDEAEQESIEAFQRQFVRYLLPSLKFSSKSPFRVANLGGHYEWGSVRFAEEHFALAPGAADGKVLVLKVNAHVSVEESPEGRRFGCAPRYGTESRYCGALEAVLAGAQEPFALRLTQDFGFEGVDRLRELRVGGPVPPELRRLYAAVVSARVQARRAMLDVQDHRAASPTLYLIVPCVTLNRAGHDTEIVLGLYTADRRGEEAHEEYCGLSDHAKDYRLSEVGGFLELTDPGIGTPRPARDHRKLVLQQWKAKAAAPPKPDGALRRALTQAHEAASSRPVATAALKTAVAALMATSPVPAALLLFGEGLVSIHHASKAHSLSKEAHGDEVARDMLRELEGRIDRLEPEQAQHLVRLLGEHYAG